MKSYECYLYLESIMTKIEKLAEPDRIVTPKSLGAEWKKLPYLDPDSNKTQKQYELILNYVERLRSREGVVAISPGFKTTYFCSFLKNAYSRELSGFEIQKGNDSFFDFIYAHEHGIVALSYSDNENPFGHDSLADRMGIPTGNIRDHYMVGGGIKFDGKKIITSELSGHYGYLWTDELRREVGVLISAATGLLVEHRSRGKTVNFRPGKPGEIVELKPYVLNGSLNFFKKSEASSVMAQDYEKTKKSCVLL